MNNKVEIKNSAKASAKSVKTSIQKANLILKKIRGKKAENAVNLLEFSNKKVSSYVLKILKSAISNAENNHQLDIDKLFIKEATVGRSMVLKRFRPRARGRSGKILKPFSKIRIIVEEKEVDILPKVSTNKKNIVKKDAVDSKKSGSKEVLENKEKVNELKPDDSRRLSLSNEDIKEDTKEDIKGDNNGPKN